MEGGAMVTQGQQVLQGDLLGLAGNSGNSAGAHLHFQAFKDRTSFNKPNAIPISFSNAIGAANADGGLIEGIRYTAGARP
jgi:murein DD-endopeptidase MepM/ murein hydrolase activator NlpD